MVYVCLSLAIVACAAIAVAALIDANSLRVLACFSTDLAPRDREQKHNIARAAARIDGRVVKPGEEFSFNKVVGPCGMDEGYQRAGTIVNGELRAEWGGGVCQLSSTLYNAALLADLPITRRLAHSQRVSSVPPGRDATVAFGIADLRFVNNTRSPIRLQATATANRLTVSILGKRGSDASRYDTWRQHVDIETTAIPAQSSAAPRYGAGGRRLLDRSRQGDVVFTYRVTTPEGGKPRREMISKDVYEVER